MARPTRQRRRERREERAEAAVDTRTRGRQVRAPAPPKEQAAHPERQRRRGRFIAECWAELKKVEWPNQRQVLTGTVAVLIACAIVGGYLWVVDLGLEPLVERIFLGK